MPKFTKQQKQTIHKIYTTLKKAGFDDISIAGMLGNALSESSFNPDSVSKSNYHGLWQNSSDIHNAIVDTYGNHNIDTQLRYVIDWTNAHKSITKGKHRDWLATGAGKFKKSGYKNAQEASDAFMKIYERPVIKDKNGNIIGYQKHGERRANSDIMYDYIADTYGIKEKPVIYEDIVKPVDWSQSEKRIVPIDISTPPAKPVHTDVPMKAEAPDILSMWNSPDSYAYGGTTPRVPDAQEVNSRINHDILNMIGIDPTINKFQIPFAPKYDKGKNATVRTLPRFDDGTPTTVGPYNIYPSALRPTNQDIPYSVTTPEINIYGQDKRPLYQRYDAYGSTYDPNAIRNITDWLPGIGDVSQGLDAYNAFNEGNYLQAGMLGALMFAPNALEPITRPVAKLLKRGLKDIAKEPYLKQVLQDAPDGYFPVLGNDPELNKAVEMYKNPTNTGVYDKTRKKFLFSTLQDENVIKGLNNLVDLYNDNNYKIRVGSNPKIKNARQRDEFIDGLFDNLSNVNVAENTPYIITEKGGKYYYRPKGEALETSSQDMMQVVNDTGKINPVEISTHGFGHQSETPKNAIIDNENVYTTYKYNKDIPHKSGSGSEYQQRVREFTQRAKVGMADMVKRGLNINSNSDIDKYLNLPKDQLPRNVVDLLDNFGREQTKKMLRNVISNLTPLFPAGTALWMEAKDFKKEDLDNSINNLRALVEGIGLYNKKK